MQSDDYLKKQIITYLGNKRKLIYNIEDIVKRIYEEKQEKLIIGDGFSGSGIVSRMLKRYGKELYVNDISDYSKILNQCFLSNISPSSLQDLTQLVNESNSYVDSKIDSDETLKSPWISKHWAPRGEITENDRVYFSEKNAKRIDWYYYFIQEKVPNKYKHFLHAILIVQSSIHNNTLGQFSSFLKDENNTYGKFGGKNENDLERILSDIKMELPVYENHNCKVFIDKKDTNQWIKNDVKYDLVYYDPPYNKHPYCIYYFLLDIIANWDTTTNIPDTVRGQPKNWKKSQYNSLTNAESAFEELINNTNSNYILISYNNTGIIKPNKMEEILNKYGNVEKITLEHKTYNRYKGVNEKKRQKKVEKISEYLWLLKKY
jgi:adenine-specific DNA-methyltransferase